MCSLNQNEFLEACSPPLPAAALFLRPLGAHSAGFWPIQLLCEVPEHCAGAPEIRGETWAWASKFIPSTRPAASLRLPQHWFCSRQTPTAQGSSAATLRSAGAWALRWSAWDKRQGLSVQTHIPPIRIYIYIYIYIYVYMCIYIYINIYM